MLFIKARLSEERRTQIRSNKMLKESENFRRFVSSLPVALLALCSLIILQQTASPFNQVLGFHLSFNNRLLKSVTNPQLNPANTLIRPVECRNANNHSEVGICMFAIDCMQNKGVPLSVCKHNYFVGTCCRLPDYNNFVGIVYDLRDTETNQLVEARGLPPSPASATGNALLQGRTNVVSGIHSSGVSALPPKPIESASTETSSTEANPSVGTDFSAQKARPESLSSTAATTTTQLPSSKAPQLKDTSPADRLDEKYMISSTNLFPSTIVPPAITQTESIRNQPSQQQQLTTREALKVAPQVNNVGESARNADGGLPSSFIISSLAAAASNQPKKQQQVVMPSESDSFQIQTTTMAVNQSHNQMQEAEQQQQHHLSADATRKPSTDNHQQSAYDLIKDNDSLEILSTISSVHSAPSAQQQFNIEHNAVQQDIVDSSHKLRPLGSESQDKLQLRVQQQQQNSIYSLIDAQLSPKSSLPQQTIVLANNHQQQSSTLRPPTSSSVEPSQLGKTSSAHPLTSDQEFTISSTLIASTSSQEESGKMSTSWPSAASSSYSILPSSNFELLSNPSTSISAQPQQSSTNSPPLAPLVVDLVSSGNSAQTTTPFTTSLSTALLPNVSSHPFNPTTGAPLSSLVPSPLATQLNNSNATSSTGSGPKQTTISSSTVSQKPVPMAESAASSIGFSQLYSSQHAATSSTASAASSNKNKPLYITDDHGGHHLSSLVHLNRPNLIIAGGSPALHATTKIVAGTSSTNHLLPGLSNLQSAILSNIPYKLASHLSSGLSSYFQTAMKPAGSRPLLSSNTAPSLQYQQQMQQQQQQLQANSSTKLAAGGTTSGGGTIAHQQPASAIKFPGLAVASLALPQPDSASATILGNEIVTTGSPSWQLGSLGVSSSTAAPIFTAYDVAREAQQVCGRPQVSHSPSSGQPIGEGGKKRVARIVGGKQSSFGQWPWMVSLRQWRKGAFLHKCGAALLNENWAITAAHCVENVKVTDLLLRLGEFDVSNQEEPFPFAERRVKSVVSHPSFDPKTFEYDLALLRFSEPIKYERNIIPVCVPSGNDTYVDRMATVIGWGRLYEDGPLPDVIQHVDVPIITNNECEKMYKDAGFIEEIPEMFICAGISKGGRDSCEGDSGGPLTMVDHDGRSYLVGIISWGIGCAIPSQPGVYTRITAFSNWINQIATY